MNNINKKKKKGFSLIELIIVLAVMAIIALIAIPNFNAVKNNSKIKADTQSCNALSRSVETLLVDESVKGTGTITITYSGTGSKTITSVVSSGVTVNEKVFPKSDEAKPLSGLDDYIEELMSDQSGPQENAKTKYIVTITSNKVTSVVTN